MKSFFFDIDTDLANPKRAQFRSNKLNQEFEYFVLWLESNLTTAKIYDLKYLEKIEKRTQTKKNINPVNTDSYPFVYDYTNPSLEKLNSKKYCEHLNKELFGKRDYTIKDFEADEFILKPSRSFSGIGILKSSLHMDKIKEIKDFSSWVVEPLFKRSLDFSTLYLSADKSVVYETIIDPHFQFKGLRFLSPNIPSKLVNQYQEEKNKILEVLKREGVSYPFSIDSFLYHENDQEKIRTMCEINMRKTMGYFAYKCAQIFNFSICGLYIISQSKKIEENDSVIKLDPGDTRFGVYMLKADTYEELRNQEKSLFF